MDGLLNVAIYLLRFWLMLLELFSWFCGLCCFDYCCMMRFLVVDCLCWFVGFVAVVCALCLRIVCWVVFVMLCLCFDSCGDLFCLLLFHGFVC